MSAFGETLFGGSGFVRWLLTPFVLLFAILMPLLIEEWTLTRFALMAGMEAMCLSLLAGFWLPRRFGRVAFRVLAGAVFLAYTGYVVDEFILSDKPFQVSGRRGEASPFNALLGFLIIGLPCLWYTLFGRFSLGREDSRASRPDPETKDRLRQ